MINFPLPITAGTTILRSTTRTQRSNDAKEYDEDYKTHGKSLNSPSEPGLMINLQESEPDCLPMLPMLLIFQRLLLQ